MTTDEENPPGGSGRGGSNRQERLAARLRDNLKKRKEQARLKQAAPTEQSSFKADAADLE